jgi:hypothetical protein
MTSPYLSDDCIYNILKYLQDYQSTLFNCLFVNRFWCRATIPFLYANPFFKTNKDIIFTLIPSFSNTEILQLKSQLKLLGVNKIDIKDEYIPLFKYPKYLKTYNSFNVNSTIFEWFEGLSYSSYVKYRRRKILEDFCPIFHQSILNHCINIEQFSIDINFIKSFNIPTTYLTKLNSLSLYHLDQEIGKEFLSNVAIHCLNLKELKICSLTKYGIKISITEKLRTIIQKQNNLEEFKISFYPLNDNLFSSLEFQKHSLVSIEFSDVDFSNTSFKNLISLYNLNHLIFSGCKDDISTLERYEILKFASFKLKRLEFISNKWDKNIIPTIIKYLGTSLQFLLLNGSITISMIENISLYCLNLITLEIIISGYCHFDLSLSPYFKSLVKRKLNINITNSHGYNLSEMFISLANNLSVKEI